MKVLFIGGTGNLSSACSNFAIDKGIELYHLNRGKSADTYSIRGAKTIIADIRNFEESTNALSNYQFDAVVDFIAFEPEHIKNEIKLFNGKTKQFIFISSASVYQTPEKLPVTEQYPIGNPFWEYSRKKIDCENILKEEFSKNGFPYTIIRPSHTYGKTLFPLIGGYTVLNRMLEGKQVVVPGDGTSIWTLTHHKDFAVGLVGLLGNPSTINETFHITSDEWLTWNGIYNIFARELGIEAHLVHIPSDIIIKYDKIIGEGLIGDKAHSMIFDNTKIKKFVPEFNAKITFETGVKEIMKWYNENKSRLISDDRINNFMDLIANDLNTSNLMNHQ